MPFYRLASAYILCKNNKKAVKKAKKLYSLHFFAPRPQPQTLRKQQRCLLDAEDDADGIFVEFRQEHYRAPLLQQQLAKLSVIYASQSILSPDPAMQSAPKLPTDAAASHKSTPPHLLFNPSGGGTINVAVSASEQQHPPSKLPIDAYRIDANVHAPSVTQSAAWFADEAAALAREAGAAAQAESARGARLRAFVALCFVCIRQVFPTRT